MAVFEATAGTCCAARCGWSASPTSTVFDMTWRRAARSADDLPGAESLDDRSGACSTRWSPTMPCWTNCSPVRASTATTTLSNDPSSAASSRATISIGGDDDLPDRGIPRRRARASTRRCQAGGHRRRRRQRCRPRRATHRVAGIDPRHPSPTNRRHTAQLVGACGGWRSAHSSIVVVVAVLAVLGSRCSPSNR